MESLTTENRMYQMAIELITKRYPSGWGGAAVIHTTKDNFFTSVALNSSVKSSTLVFLSTPWYDVQQNETLLGL